MDPLSIVSTVISTAVAIQTWIDQRQMKHATIRELGFTISRISLILTPLQSKSHRDGNIYSDPSVQNKNRSSGWTHIDPAITTCLQDMCEILNHVKDDLVLWRDKRSKAAAVLEFLRPSIVLARIQEDDRRLSRRLDILSFALQVYLLRTSDTEPAALIPPEKPKPPSLLEEVTNEEVRRFWAEKIGVDSCFIDGKSLCRELAEWLEIDLDQTSCDTLLLRLDEYALGGVSPSSLDKFIGRQGIRDAVAGLGVVRNIAVVSESQSMDRSTIKPLLVWIDDVPGNIAQLVEYARKLDVAVISLTSTASAKVWIEANEGLLRKADYASRLRFISDSCRWETDGINAASSWNLTAGEAILRYLRGRMYRAPVLIHCGPSITHTGYVKSFSRAGSTVDRILCQAYIEALAAGIDTDHEWEGFDTLSTLDGSFYP